MPKAKPPDAVAEIAPVLKAWKQPDSAEVAKLAELTGKSLDAVTHLTEYEDEKANRVFTAMTFISAFAGLMFATIVGHYSNGYLQQLRLASRARFVLLSVDYATFGLYALIVSLGVASSLYGMKPRFNLPKAWQTPSTRPKSFLFFEKINEVRPGDWAQAFSSKPVEDLAFEYVKNNVLESYLISEKIPKKLRPLKNASSLYFASTCVLVVWIIMTAATIAWIDVFPSPAVSTIKTSERPKISRGV